MKSAEALEKYEAWLIRERLSPLTRESYLGWAQRYFDFKDPAGSTVVEDRISNFLSSYWKRSEATVRQALNALAGRSGFYAAMDRKIGELPPWVSPSLPFRVPTWVTQSEAEAIISQLTEAWALMVGLLFGSGLRIGECMRLRWQDIDFERLTVTVRRGKGRKDRITVLSRRLVAPLLARRERCRGLWRQDRDQGRPGVALPEGMELKFKNFGVEWPYFWVFPAAGESGDPSSGIVRRHHVHQKSLAKPLRTAVRRARISKRVTAHTFRHGFATLYLINGGNLRELQRLLGHKDLTTTEVYLHCLPNEMDRIGSPWDIPAPVREDHPQIIAFQRSA